MNLKKSAARVGSNFMISFFGSLVTFDFVTETPTDQVIFGSLIFSGVMSMLSMGYELRRYAESPSSV
jgi:hypothetical protein